MNKVLRGTVGFFIIAAVSVLPPSVAADELGLAGTPAQSERQYAPVAADWPGCVPGHLLTATVQVASEPPLTGSEAPSTRPGTAIVCSPTGEFPYPVDPYAYWPNFEQIRGIVEERTERIVGPLLSLGKPVNELAEEIITEGPIAVPDEE
ncbi:MAG: hypothetical protein KatS3mg060_1469 [Dehalococcoidia bacterium]|nr:MAG: hypothetical protein KatS3mg060_1469 [Dehalococcoidia bacterium]